MTLGFISVHCMVSLCVQVFFHSCISYRMKMECLNGVVLEYDSLVLRRYFVFVLPVIVALVA